MPAHKYPYDLEKVHEAMTALDHFSEHLSTVRTFLTYCTLTRRPDDNEVSKAFWPNEKHPCSTIENEAKRVFWSTATKLETAFSAFHCLYTSIIDIDINAAKREAELAPDSEGRKRIQRHRDWLAKMAEWIAEILAKHYASIAQEDAAWRHEAKTGVPATQSGSMLCQYLSGRIAPATANPFADAWKRHRNSQTLRSISKHRQFINAAIPHYKAIEIIANAAKTMGCSFNHSIHRHYLNSRQFEEAWPHLCKHLAAQLREYNELAILTLRTFRKSKRWSAEIAEYLDTGDLDFEVSKDMLIDSNPGRVFRGKQVDWSEIETSCKRHAKALLCGTNAQKPEWRRFVCDLLPPENDSAHLFITS